MKNSDNKKLAPLYREISDILRKQIKNGELKIGDYLPSENELSKKFSISRMTARTGILQLEREGLTRTILGKGRVITEGNKHMPFPSQHLSSFTIATLYPFARPVDRFDPYFTPLLNGISQGLFRHHIMGKFFDKERIPNYCTSLASFFCADGIDGIVWISPTESDLPQLMELKQKKIPAVVLNRTFPGSEIDYVVCDNYTGSYRLVNYLVKMGHRKIACVTSSKSLSYAIQRWKGYSDALTQHGLPVDLKLTVEAKLADNEENSKKQFLERLHTLKKEKNCPTAFFVAGGHLIPFVLMCLNEKGMKIPDDASVVAFDEVLPPPGLSKLTCVRQPFEKMGEMAINVLIRNLQGRKTQPAEIILEPAFIQGDTCIPCYDNLKMKSSKQVLNKK